MTAVKLPSAFPVFLPKKEGSFKQKPSSGNSNLVFPQLSKKSYANHLWGSDKNPGKGKVMVG